GERVPGGAAATVLPPLAVPGLGGHGHDAVGGLAVRALGGIARDGVEAPDLLAARRVVVRHEAAHARVRAAAADPDLAVVDARRAGNGIGILAIEGLHAPDLLAGLGVHRNETPVECTDVDLPLPGGDAARRRAAAREPCPLARNLRIV